MQNTGAVIGGSAVDEARYAAGQISHYYTAIVSPPGIKIFFSTILAWIGLSYDLVLPVCVLCVVDTISGILKAKLSGTFSSRKMYRFVWKWFSYALLLTTIGALTQIHTALRPVVEWVAGMIAVTECVSTIENLKCIIDSKIINAVYDALQGILGKKIVPPPGGHNDKN